MEIILLVIVFVWLPWFCFTIYLANEKGYHNNWWIVLAFFFTLPTFMTLLGLPVKGWDQR